MPNHSCKEYQELLESYQEALLLQSIYHLLYWDLNTYMPPGALTYRTQQVGFLKEKINEIFKRRSFQAALEYCEKKEDLGHVEQRNIELLRREVIQATSIPEDLHKQLSIQSNKTLELWKKAKTKKQFNLVKPELQKLFELNQKKGELLQDILGAKTPYDALVQSNEPNFPMTIIDDLFTSAKSFLVPFIKQKTESHETRDYAFLKRRVTQQQQKAIVYEISNLLQYDTKSEDHPGRIDEVEHPLTIGCGPNDVRVTVKYHDNNVFSVMSAAIHEMGHAIHGLHKNPKYALQPINYARSPSFGESQSRYMENIIGLSYEFWDAFYPTFQELTRGTFDDISLELFYEGINQIRPGFIRIDSDEVTYSLHIIIRYELERDLFSGKLTINELPEAWNQKYHEYLGVQVPNDSLGVMQDLHWYSQFWAYFHGYAIGDYIATQIAEKMNHEIPEWKEQLRQGDFSLAKTWLRDNVHYKHGLYDTLDLVKYITNKPLSTASFKHYLQEKYKEY